MRLDLVVCPDCEGKCFFGDEVCEGCLGRGYVPESDGTCGWGSGGACGSVAGGACVWAASSDC